MQIDSAGTFIGALSSFVVSMLISSLASAHCDALDGPVVQDARLALEERNPDHVLRWVTEDREAEVLEAFEKTVAVRGQGADARELADRFFFETLVRLHRAGEGEPFTGLKPAGRIGPGIAAADRALDGGDGAGIANRLATAIEHGIAERFEIASARKRHADDSVAAGREYVEAYVDYVHFVEAVDALASHGASDPHHE